MHLCRISSAILAAIRAEAAARAPLEACGLLFGSAAAIDGWSAARNVAEDPRCRFEIDPAALFAAHRAERGGGPVIAGYWHSHPSGDAAPSATDARMAAPDGKLWLIVAGATATLWRAGVAGVHDRFEPVALVTE